MPADPLQPAARLARRLPGYRALRRQLVPRLRRNSAARALAFRLFGAAGERATGAAITPGNLVDGLGTEALAVVIIVITDADEATCRRVAEQVAQAQLMGAGFTAWFVLDTPHFAAFRPYGYVVDLVIARADWTGAASWESYVGKRISALVQRFASCATIRVSSGELDPIDVQLLSSLGTHDQEQW